MAKLEEVTTAIRSAFEKFSFNADLHSKGNKAAGVRARKFSFELEKLLKEYRGTSLNRPTKNQF